MRKFFIVALLALSFFVPSFDCFGMHGMGLQASGKASVVDFPENFSMTVGFKIENNGSLSNIRVIKSSGKPQLDRQALMLIRAISDRRALGELADLSATTVRVDFTKTAASLAFSGLAPNADVAKVKAQMIGLAVKAAQQERGGGNSDIVELLSQMRVSSQNNRLDVGLSMSRARAMEMIQARLGK